jgi:hypothetical protein
MVTPCTGRSTATVAITRAEMGSTIDRLRASRLAVTTTSGGKAAGDAAGEAAALGDGFVAGDGDTAGETAGLAAAVGAGAAGVGCALGCWHAAMTSSGAATSQADRRFRPHLLSGSGPCMDDANPPARG